MIFSQETGGILVKPFTELQINQNSCKILKKQISGEPQNSYATELVLTVHIVVLLY